MTRDQFNQVLALAQAVKSSGGRALVVGGAVRDQMMGAKSKDVDVEVFGVEPWVLQGILTRLFGSAIAAGASFGVFKCGLLDVSIPRRDSKAGTGHKGFVVTGDPHMSVTEAASRRDFTINAVSYDLLTDEYIDPFDGIQDIRRRVLRVVDAERFGDDSLRVLRGMQFAARFDLIPDARSLTIMESIDLTDLPAERVWGEFDKLLRAAYPSLGFELALQIDVVRKLWPELYALIGVPQDPEHHPEGGVWVHTLQVVDLMRRALDVNPTSYPQEMTLMLAALCHDFGKPATTMNVNNRWQSHGHEAAGLAPTTTFLDRLNVHTLNGYDVRAQVLALVEWHLMPHVWFKDQPRTSAFRRLAQKVDLMLLARLAHADRNGRYPKPLDSSSVEWFVNQVKTLDLQLGAPKPILMGRHLLDLGVKPGPQMGQVLKAVFELQLDGTVSTLDEAVAAAKVLLV